MSRPTHIEVITTITAPVNPVLWSVRFDGGAGVRFGWVQTAEAGLIAVQLAIDEMRDEK